MRGLAAVLVAAALGVAAMVSRGEVQSRDAALARVREQSALAVRESAERALRLETARLEEQVRLLAGNKQLRLGIATDAQTVQDQIAEEGLKSLRAHPVYAIGRRAEGEPGPAGAREELLVAHGLERMPLDELQRSGAVQQALQGPEGQVASGALRLPAGAALVAAAPVTSLDQQVRGYLLIGDVLTQRALDNLATQARASLLLSDGVRALGTQGPADALQTISGAIGTEAQHVERTFTDPSGTLVARALPLAPQLHLWVAASVAAEADLAARSTQLHLALIWLLALVVVGGIMLVARRRTRAQGAEHKPIGITPPPATPLEEWVGNAPAPAPSVPAPLVPVVTAPGPLVASGGTNPMGVAPSSPALFGRYRLLERLGSGGMAEVWTAVLYGAGGFRRPFVVKRIRADLGGHQGLVQQFIDEANLQSQLVHSNIVPVFDFGQMAGEYFLAQEYILGRDLGKVVAALAKAGRRLDPQLALYVCAETLKALDYAHTLADKTGAPLAIVHRDVSPNNILVSERGEVKLIDFGIAKSASKVAQTEIGTVKGNVRFMAPEQARGQATDARTDLFSLGATLAFALSGEPLYTGSNPYELLLAAAQGPQEGQRERLAQLPAPWTELLERVLAPDPSERFLSAQAMLEAVLPLTPPDGARRLAHLVQELFGDDLRRQEQQFNEAATFATPPGGSTQPELLADEATVQRIAPRMRQGQS